MTRSGEISTISANKCMFAPSRARAKTALPSKQSGFPTECGSTFFTDEKYEGGKEYTIECPFERYPVFVKEGGIIPLLHANGNSTEFKDIELKVYLGNNVYTMFDEQGKISVAMKKDESGCDVIIIPDGVKTESLTLSFAGVKDADVFVNEQKSSLETLQKCPASP